MIHQVARQQPSCRILICDGINWPLSGTFLFARGGVQEAGVSSVKNWGAAWQVLKRKRGCHPGASHVTEMTNHGWEQAGREESGARWGRGRPRQGEEPEVTGKVDCASGERAGQEAMGEERQQYSGSKKTDQAPSSAPSSHLWGLRRAPSPG